MAEREPLDPLRFLRDEVAPRLRRRVGELRTEIARLQRELDDRLAAEATIELAFEGDGGGVWYLTMRGEDVGIDERAPVEPLIRVRQSRADWEALAGAGLTGGLGGTPGGELTRSRIERLRGVNGTFEFRVGTDEGERRVTVRFGRADSGPRCAVSVRIEDALRLQAGALTPQAAFLQGALRLEGDVAFAMQLGAALFL